jgi:hypothetical protein
MNAKPRLTTETLHKIAERYQSEGMKRFDAVELAASNLNLPVTGQDSACKIYKIEDNVLTNCWVG